MLDLFTVFKQFLLHSLIDDTGAIVPHWASLYVDSEPYGPDLRANPGSFSHEVERNPNSSISVLLVINYPADVTKWWFNIHPDSVHFRYYNTGYYTEMVITDVTHIVKDSAGTIAFSCKAIHSPEQDFVFRFQPITPETV